MKPKPTILLGHGSGGQLSHDLIKDHFITVFSNELLLPLGDAAIFQVNTEKLAFTTDSFVVDPLFFPGGNIGNLAVAGTVNDLAVSGAIPAFLSIAFILEEGFKMADLDVIVQTIASEAHKAGIKIITGDTKVVERGKVDKIFINTSGIGFLRPGTEGISEGKDIQLGDKILVNGAVGNHGMAVMSARNQLSIFSEIKSDCACLHELIDEMLKFDKAVKFMRDATRGGIGTVISELCEGKSFGINLIEDTIPVNENVRGMCELLGFDPLYVANEGKVVAVVAAEKAEEILQTMKNHPLGGEAAIIGEITDQHPGRTWLHTITGGKRIVDMPAGEQLPRIC